VDGTVKGGTNAVGVPGTTIGSDTFTGPAVPGAGLGPGPATSNDGVIVAGLVGAGGRGVVTGTGRSGAVGEVVPPGAGGNSTEPPEGGGAGGSSGSPPIRCPVLSAPPFATGVPVNDLPPAVLPGPLSFDSTSGAAGSGGMWSAVAGRPVPPVPVVATGRRGGSTGLVGAPPGDGRGPIGAAWTWPPVVPEPCWVGGIAAGAGAWTWARAMIRDQKPGALSAATGGLPGGTTGRGDAGCWTGAATDGIGGRGTSSFASSPGFALVGRDDAGSAAGKAGKLLVPTAS